MRAVNHYLMSPPASFSWLCESRQHILQIKSHTNLDRPGKLEIGKKKPPTAVKTRSFATCIMRRNHSYSHRERGRANYDKHSFYTVKVHPVCRRGCDWGRRGDTHKSTKPLLHKSFPYWHDWLGRNMAVRKRWMGRRRQYKTIQGDQF